MSLVEQIKNAGVIGAGGAGFPTHVKMAAEAEWMLANGAECEPLMHKDRELMLHFADEIVKGMKLAQQATHARQAVFGIKSKNAEAITAIKKAIGRQHLTVHEFDDYYPAGDEYEIVHEITGKLIPAGGIPLEVGAVVNNIETLYNIYQASQGIPVTQTFLTITGLVKNPMTVWVPVGMRVAEVLKLAGAATTDAFAVMESGLMMGKLIDNLEQPVRKTTGGLIVLPKSHQLIQRYEKPEKQKHQIGLSSCDQCSYCTELCPRYLLGYPVEPHKVMRSLGFSMTGPEIWNISAQLCSGCGLCSLYSCPEGLYPREACKKGIEDLQAIGQKKWAGTREVEKHPMKESRRVPVKRLMNRLGVTEYDAHAAYTPLTVDAAVVEIALDQHIGTPAQPVVTVGEIVEKGQLIGAIPADKLGATVHASISGRITKIDNTVVTIERNA